MPTHTKQSEIKWENARRSTSEPNPKEAEENNTKTKSNPNHRKISLRADQIHKKTEITFKNRYTKTSKIALLKAHNRSTTSHTQKKLHATMILLDYIIFLLFLRAYALRFWLLFFLSIVIIIVFFLHCFSSFFISSLRFFSRFIFISYHEIQMSDFLSALQPLPPSTPRALTLSVAPQCFKNSVYRK